MSRIQLFPQRANVGKDVITPQYFNVKFAEKLIKTGLWGYKPKPTSDDDISLMLGRAKDEISSDMRLIAEEKERLKKEREDLEALRAELLTSDTVKRGRPKAEV
jgi:ActR/RegA family two-component response regulator